MPVANPPRPRIVSREETLLTAREVSILLGASPRWVLDKWQAGVLPGFRLSGKMVRFRASEIDTWLNARHRGPSDH